MNRHEALANPVIRAFFTKDEQDKLAEYAGADMTGWCDYMITEAKNALNTPIEQQVDTSISYWHYRAHSGFDAYALRKWNAILDGSKYECRFCNIFFHEPDCPRCHQEEYLKHAHTNVYLHPNPLYA